MMTLIAIKAFERGVLASDSASKGHSAKSGLVRRALCAAVVGAMTLTNLMSTHKAQAAPGQVGMNFWFRADWAEGGTNKVWRSGANFSTDTNPYNQAFLDELEPYSTLRFMDWVPTNNSPQTNWSDRRSKTDSVQVSDPNGAKGVAYEWMITLCNLKNAHMWITVPHRASDDYVWQLATLIRNNLNSNLRVYVEYSNETWNSGFSQHQYCIDQGRALGLHNLVTNTGPDDNGRAGYSFYVYRAVRVWKTFNDVFGSSSGRVRKVLAGMGNDGWQRSTWSAALNNGTINPNNLRPDFVANAPYVGFGVNGTDSNALTQLYTQGDAEKNSAASFKTNVRNTFNCPAVTYEAGQHVTNNAHIINRNAGMYDWYKDFLSDMAPSYELIMLYAHSSTFDTYGAWGAKEYIGQPASQAHKYRGIADWINANGGNGKTSANLLSNPSFEAEQFYTQTPSGWNEWEADANWNSIAATSSYSESNGGSQGGNYHGTHWNNRAYRVFTGQTKTGLQNGLYTARVWARRGSGQIVCQLEAKDYGGAKLVANVPVSNTYQLLEIRNINVTNGQCTVGLWSDAYANNWCHFDSFELIRQ